MASAIIDFLYKWSFELFGITFNSNNITNTINSMCNFNKVKSLSLYSMGSTINNIVVPVGLSLLTLFMMISFIKMVQDGVERITWERIVFKAIIFFLLVYLINHSYDFITTIMNIINKMFIDIRDGLSLSNVEGLGIAKALKESLEHAGFIDSILYTALYIILAIPFNATIIMIITQVFTRIVKLICCIAFTPIPTAMAVEGDTYRGKAISYFMYTAAIGCEAIIIYIGLYIYAIGFNQIGSVDGAVTRIIALLFLNGIFSAVISFGSQFCERLFSRG